MSRIFYIKHTKHEILGNFFIHGISKPKLFLKTPIWRTMNNFFYKQIKV